MLNQDLAEYYAKRAPEYEAIYAKPERQEDLAILRDFLRAIFAGRHVLEIACGTGYWTETLADCAASIFATDINEEVLQIARSKPRLSAQHHIQFTRADAYILNAVPQKASCLIAFWWSHIPKERIAEFLETVKARVLRGGIVVVIDNRYVSGSSSPVSRIDANGNTFQLRKLADGSTHEVLKNFPTTEELRKMMEPFAIGLEILELQYYWILHFRMKE